MSLKAYDGMMTRKGFSYLYDKIKENLPLFREASEKKLAETIGDIFVSDADSGISIKTSFSLSDCDRETDDKVKALESENAYDYLIQAAHLLSKSIFINGFTVSLNLTIEPKGDKILVYPGIAVNEHREILRSFLEDWYAQNSTDPPEDVPEEEWKERCDDWWGFNENREMRSTIKLFDPKEFSGNIIRDLGKDRLIDLVISSIPSDDERAKRIQKNQFISFIMERLKESDKEMDLNESTRYYFKAIDYIMSEEGKKEFDDYRINNPVSVVKIDRDYILNKKIECDLKKDI